MFQLEKRKLSDVIMNLDNFVIFQHYKQLLISQRQIRKKDRAFYEGQKNRTYHVTANINLGVSKFLEREEERLSKDFT